MRNLHQIQEDIFFSSDRCYAGHRTSLCVHPARPIPDNDHRCPACGTTKEEEMCGWTRDLVHFSLHFPSITTRVERNSSRISDVGTHREEDKEGQGMEGRGGGE